MSTLQAAKIKLHTSEDAPLPMDALAECLKPFGESRMLPRAAYVDDEFWIGSVNICSKQDGCVLGAHLC